MIIEMPEDNSIIRWKYKNKCKCAEISDLILSYEKQEKGEWIEDGYRNLPCVCSYCGEEGNRTNYCPNCGAKMKQD